MILSLCPNPSIDTYAWLSDFKSGEVNRIERLEEFPGGKGIHVALALAELGEASRLMGNWAGNAGEAIKDSCIQKGISITGVSLEGNNRKCYTFRSSDPSFNNSELLEPGPSMTSDTWEAFKNKFQEEAAAAELICMSGSWPKNAPANAYGELIAIAHAANTKVILDCSGEQLDAALKEGFFGLHLNEQEAENLCGSTELDALVDKLGGKVELIALTKGKDGLYLSYKGQSIHANVKIDKVISTVGSGDCLTAGIAYAVNKDLKLKEIAAYGVACGAANCLIEDLGMLQRSHVEDLLAKVEFNEIQK